MNKIDNKKQKFSDTKIEEILLAGSYITNEDIEDATKNAKENKMSTIEYLIDKEIINEDILGQAIAETVGAPYINLKKEKIDETVLVNIPEVMARNKGVIVFYQDLKKVKIAMTDPSDLETKDLIEKKFSSYKNEIYFTTEQGLSYALSLYRADLSTEVKKIAEKLKGGNVSKEERDDLTIQLVQTLLSYGHENGASDIHIEPREEDSVVRFRIDGVLHNVLKIAKEIHEPILMRIKILAKLKTDEHFAAQDGKLTLKMGEEKADVRVSVVPVTEGENIVMRILSARSRQFSLEDLGFTNDDLNKINRAIKKPYGMILATGPTGSGKTTTLYAILKILNKPDIHISTIEDPVEYDVEGVSQIQVNTRTELTFAKGLRAIVRQDPDIIMVGEIRDEETASIAVNSAMTGHLLLSTLHTNDAATTMPRLLDMGIEPFLVASTVNVIIAQRLVRQLCIKCRVSHKLTDDEKSLINREPELKQCFSDLGYDDLNDVTFFVSNEGCKACGGTGYSDRIGVHEVLEINDEIKDLIVKRATSDDIRDAAKKNGMKTMLEDGIDKVFKGITTLEEVLRVVKSE